MEDSEPCLIFDEHSGVAPGNPENNSFFSQTPRELHQNTDYDHDVGPIGTNFNFNSPAAARAGQNSTGNYGYPRELNRENMSLYNSIFDQQASVALSPSMTRNHISLDTASTLTIESDAHRRPHAPAASTARKSKLKGVSDKEAALLARDDNELSEEELQVKRKAQNRLAQRAFRERKETRMKELELKLTQSEDDRKRLLDQLDLIRKHNLTMQTENERLKGLAQEPLGQESQPDGFSFAFPRSQDDFVHTMVGDMSGEHAIDNSNISRVYELPQQPGEKILAVGAVWDYLVRLAEELDWDIDVIEVMNELKGHERCHGYGPAYPLKLVQSVAERCSSR